MNRSQASCDSDNNNNNHNHNDDWRLQRASEFESKSKFERNDDCSIVHDRLYRFWCVICLYYLAIFYTLIELWLKVRKWRGDNVLSLNDDKDALRTVPAGFTVMITGAERGIGWETAQLLLSRGCRVIVASLLLGNSTEQQVLSNLQSQISDQNQKQLLQVWHLDLSSMRSVCNVAQRVRQENVKINVLINNAGVMTIPFALSEDGFEMHLAVNYLGHCLLTLLLAPSLEAAAQQFGIRSRIVCLSSSTHYVRPIRVQEVNRVEHIRSYRFSEYHAYSQSKSLVITFVLHFARQFPQFETFALHPGVASSHLYRHELVFRLFPFLLHGLRTPKEAASGVAYVALTRKLDGKTALYLEDKELKRPAQHTLSMVTQKLVYEKTIHLLRPWIQSTRF